MLNENLFLIFAYRLINLIRNILAFIFLSNWGWNYLNFIYILVFGARKILFLGFIMYFNSPILPRTLFLLKLCIFTLYSWIILRQNTLIWFNLYLEMLSIFILRYKVLFIRSSLNRYLKIIIVVARIWDIIAILNAFIILSEFN